ncbi:MAG: C4-type zinc ribbon domain-containing protein [Actinomycetota bacterium]|nr:C4-type zinc ribbon domain-containing protein [Actinomycetota bacterium]
MAEPFDTLMAVQEPATAIDQLRRRRETLEARQALEAVHARRSALATEVAGARVEVEALAARQGELDAQIAAAAARRHEIEARMRSGTVTDARDLQAMDGEVHNLAERQSRLEEEELELLEAQEPLDALVAEAAGADAALAAEALAHEDEVRRADAAIDAELEVLGAERAALAEGLPSELRVRYEALRSRLGGVGAARLVGDHCDGCHLALPSMEVERIRNLPADEFATCDQCGRILVH